MTDLSIWQNAPLNNITAHIVPRYHDTHRSQMAEMLELGEKVAEVHAGSFPEDFVPLVQAIQNELLSHMRKEERILFPMIDQGAGSGAAMPIRMMMHEHDDHQGAIAQLRSLTNDFGKRLRLMAATVRPGQRIHRRFGRPHRTGKQHPLRPHPERLSPTPKAV